MKTILVPIDFSPASNNLLNTATTLAQKTKAAIILLHVVEVSEEGSFNVEGELDTSLSWENRLFDKMLIKKAQAQLAAIKKETEDKGVTVLSQLRVGSAFHNVTSVIAEQKADLVILGARSDDEPGLGSTTEKIIRRTICPVLTVSNAVRTDFKSIVLATALTDAELIVPEALQQFISSDNSVVHIVRVNTPGGFASDYQIKDKLKEFAERLQIKRYTLNVYSDFSEEAGITHFAESVNADLVAMTSHRRTGISLFLTRSIAEDVIGHAPCPVLTYPLKPVSNG